MKKDLPTPAIVAIIVLAVTSIGFVFVKLTGSGPEIKEQPRSPNYTKEMPDYVKKATSGQGGAPVGAGTGAPAVPTFGNGSQPAIPESVKQQMQSQGK